MEEIEGWLLDVTAEADGGPHIFCWAKDHDGRTFIIDCRFKNYFHIVPKEGADGITLCLKKLGMDFESVYKNLSGRAVSCYRVYVDEEDLSDAASNLIKSCSSPFEVLEDDMRYTSKFLVSHRLRPSSWLRAELGGASSIEGMPVYEARSLRLMEGRLSRPHLRVLAVDCLYFAERGTARPDRDPIVAISLVGEGIERQLVGDEATILRSFIPIFQEYDPDVLVGFGVSRRHWPYMLERARRCGLKLSIGRLGSEPQTSLYGHVSIRGRINIDLEDAARDTPELELESLEEYASFLGIPFEAEPIEEHELHDRWNSDRESVLAYSMERARAIFRIYRALEDYIFSLSEVTGIPADHVLTAATGFRVENYLMYLASELNELIPKRVGVAHVSYVGGMVKAPTKGMHTNVAVIDFRSMYPSIMIKYNVSFDTLSEDGENQAPGLPYRFKKGSGFLPRALTTLMSERRKVQEVLSSPGLTETERKVLQAKQKVLKLIANAIYGYTGWAGARWYAREVAESTAAWGREVVSAVHKKADELGLQVLYSDTDSVFVKMEEEKVKRLLEWTSEVLGLEARVDKVYSRILFTEAKKKYAGLTEDGRIELVGLEAVRGDWSRIAKESQLSVVEALLRTGRKDVALQRLLEYIDGLRGMRVPLKKLIIWKQITRSLDEYEANQPHVVVARKLMARGWHISPGDKVGYIIKKGPGKLYEKAEAYFGVKPEDVDWDYYINKQVLPACMRILEAVGVTEKEVARASTSSLTRFL